MLSNINALLISVQQNDDVFDPRESFYDEWVLKSFSHRHFNYVDPKTVMNFTPEDKEKMQNKAFFLLSYYEHSVCEWALYGKSTIQCQFDTVQLAGYLHFNGDITEFDKDENATLEEKLNSREESAKKYLETYNHWANGHIFLIRINEIEESPDSDSYYDHEDDAFGYDELLETVKRLAFQAKEGYSKIEILSSKSGRVDKNYNVQSNDPDTLYLIANSTLAIDALCD